jgi:hypothetical protein
LAAELLLTLLTALPLALLALLEEYFPLEDPLEDLTYRRKLTFNTEEVKILYFIYS